MVVDKMVSYDFLVDKPDCCLFAEFDIIVLSKGKKIWNY